VKIAVQSHTLEAKTAEGAKMKKRMLLTGLLGLTLGVLTAQAQETPMDGMKTGDAASHAAGMTDMMGAPGLVPFDIMTGQAGRWMVGYQFMYEKLDGILDGTHRISETNVLDRFQTTPTDMAMHMHMEMVMYAPTDKLTLMEMFPYVGMSMGELHRDGTRSVERSEGEKSST
jgi:hypothetical protein